MSVRVFAAFAYAGLILCAGVLRADGAPEHWGVAAAHVQNLAFAIGISSFLNGKVVLRKGMQYMVFRACLGLFISSLGFLMVALSQQGMPPLSWTTVYLLAAFGCIGVLFGNLNALAMEPLGHLAGIGAAVVGALSTLIAALIAITVAQFFNNTMLPLTTAFTLAAAGAGLVIYWVEKNRNTGME